MTQEQFQVIVLESMNSLRTEIADMKNDIGWIKGKLEGRTEGRAWILSILTTGTAIAAMIIALIALLK